MDSIPILDIDYKAGEEEAAEVAGSVESSWYCSKHPPDACQTCHVNQSCSQHLWAWLGEPGSLKTDPGCRYDMLRSKSGEPLSVPGAEGWVLGRDLNRKHTSSS